VLEFYLPWVFVTLPWLWVHVGFLPSGGIRFECYNPRKISALFGPVLCCEIQLLPDKIVVDSDNMLYWRSPRLPGHWKYEFEDWGRKGA